MAAAYSRELVGLVYRCLRPHPRARPTPDQLVKEIGAAMRRVGIEPETFGRGYMQSHPDMFTFGKDRFAIGTVKWQIGKEKPFWGSDDEV
ncbi:hypothetical protein BDY21DRAFT_352480 [Lineolata rhizophorae]|uniref:Protein kinase domain-containing protein n=1 Tax=Lineolata rhizophorae TaxID=578093 RepID=A0A6A6NSE1_9PEZI|nr:hypothetical protein BDY21DRAFT_352480 [Lineolata rhizophorae]